ncbi:hypothetical protein FISHEDRAFT_56533 [Fistulina hepatica ATCC 64428]|uniref:Uncharacterized protein n=1 Tax=Fistulina hepatica ATCC 64428 TaxID=1128425 RepID=A0A0D7AIC4_9AGAR|nr:hypothetical protein FISHEDRAFT_56533 [Fistulina hepatica ATCC 64428]
MSVLEAVFYGLPASSLEFAIFGPPLSAFGILDLLGALFIASYEAVVVVYAGRGNDTAEFGDLDIIIEAIGEEGGQTHVHIGPGVYSQLSHLLNDAQPLDMPWVMSPSEFLLAQALQQGMIFVLSSININNFFISKWYKPNELS